MHREIRELEYGTPHTGLLETESKFPTKGGGGTLHLTDFVNCLIIADNDLTDIGFVNLQTFLEPGSYL